MALSFVIAELPQAQSIEVVRIYVQQMIGRNEWGQGIILKPTCGGRMAASPSPVVVDNYIPISLEQFEVPITSFPIDTFSTQSLTLKGVRVKSTCWNC